MIDTNQQSPVLNEGTDKAPTALEDMSVKSLQAYATELGFIGSETLTTKAPLISIITSFQAKNAEQKKAIDEALAKQNETDDQVRKTIKTPDGKEKVLNPLAPSAEDRVSEKSSEKSWKGKALAMRDHLALQPKVSIMIPLEFKEKRGAYETVILNGWRMSILKGVMVQVPQQVAEIIAESYQLTAEAGQKFLIDRDDQIKEQLNGQ